MSLTHARELLSLLQLRSDLDPIEAGRIWSSLGRSVELPRLLAHEDAALWLHRRLHDLSLANDSPVGSAVRLAAHAQLIPGLRVDQAVLEATGHLRDAGIPFALIKGPARRVAALLYPYGDARSTLDVDVLVPQEHGESAWRYLLEHGYEIVAPGSEERRDHFHLPGVWNAHRVAVELHTSTAPWLTPAESWRRQVAMADLVTWNGVELQVASATELLWHAMAHAFIDGHEGFRLRTFLDGAVVVASGRPIAWDVIQERIADGEILEAETGLPVMPAMLHRWIATAGILAGTAVPATFAGDGQFPLARMLSWKARVLSSRLGRAARGRLLEEGMRVEVGMQLTLAHRGDRLVARARRRAASVLARAGYLGWRAIAVPDQGAS